MSDAGRLCYATVVVDRFSRAIVSWRVMVSLRTELALNASRWPSGWTMGRKPEHRGTAASRPIGQRPHDITCTMAGPSSESAVAETTHSCRR
jgi:transposase InsO family protein